MRRGFESYASFSNVAGGSVLIGQTWSPFIDLTSYPETLDLNGPFGHRLHSPADAALRARPWRRQQGLPRRGAAYADFEGAVSYPVYSGGGAPSTNINPIPDFVGNFTYDASWATSRLPVSRDASSRHRRRDREQFQRRQRRVRRRFIGAASIETIGQDTINLQGVGGPGIDRYLFGEDDSGGSAASLVYCGSPVACGLQRTTAFGAAASLPALLDAEAALEPHRRLRTLCRSQ